MHGVSVGSEHTSIGEFNARYVWLISWAAAMGGLLFGYDWVVIGGAKPFYEKYFHLDSEQLIGWANSCALLGCLLGSMVAGWMSDRFGRKRLLVSSAVLFAVSSAFTGLAATFLTFVCWRIVGGLAIGIASNVSPTYIAEVSPARWRGRLVSLNQMTIVIGILAAQVANWLIAERVPENASAEMIRQSWNGQLGWRWMFAAVVVPSVVFFVAALFVPESPRWLMKIGKPVQARIILRRIGGEAYAENAVSEIESTLGSEGGQAVRWADLLAPGVSKALIIGVVLAVLQQWSGINVIFNYAEEIYRNAGYGVSGILFNIVITGTINLICTLIALTFVDKLGAAAANALRLRGRRPISLLDWLDLPAGPHGPAGSGFHALHHWLLRDVARAGDLGFDLGNLSQPRARVGRGDFCFGALDCVVYSHLYVPADQSAARIERYVLALRGCLYRRVYLCLEEGSGDQRPDAGAD